jgi:hypothetical protein
VTGDVTQVIQLAIAPVFLLSSLGTFLGVLSARLGRIVDRARQLMDRALADETTRAYVDVELIRLTRRRRYVNTAIASATVAALSICTLIATAFIGSLAEISIGAPVATLFIVAMGAFVVAWVSFLREVLLASAEPTVRP